MSAVRLTAADREETYPSLIYATAAAQAASASARKRRSVGRLMRCLWTLKVFTSAGKRWCLNDSGFMRGVPYQPFTPTFSGDRLALA